MEIMRSVDFWTPILLSVQITLAASLISFILAIGLAWWLKSPRVRGRAVWETLIMLPLVLPPTVVGFLLLWSLGRRSPVGRWVEEMFGQGLVFHWSGAVVAATVVALPLIYQTLKVGFQSVDPELAEAARVGGAAEWQVFLYVILPLSRRALVAGYLLGFARGLGEFGATLMIAGNIPGQTQTLPTAIYIAAERGDMALAGAWVVMMVLLSFAMMLWIQSGRKN